jgi:hypothetical protein
MALPAMTDGLSLWVTEFSIASRETIGSRHWKIQPDYSSLFIQAVRVANAKRPRRAKSAVELGAELAEQAADGLRAEEWVVSSERLRLAGHPLLDQIRRISDDDVAAGYDIVSFSNLGSIAHDLHIEVKSFGRVKRFFWTRNEIATAEEFGSQYALYLVDRNRLDDPDYSPHVVIAPTPEMFLGEGSGWSVSATAFEHIAVETG